MNTEILYGIILILASLSSALIMHYVDKNKDGNITKEEIEQTITEALKKK